MDRINTIEITGIFKTEAITATFTKQFLAINTKDSRDGAFKEAQFDMYIKPDIISQWNIQEGQEIKVKGWIAFNFNQQGRSFPKMVVTEVLEVGQAQAQPAYQGQGQTQAYPAQQQPTPGQTPQAPQAPGQIPQVPGQVPQVPPQAPQTPNNLR